MKSKILIAFTQPALREGPSPARAEILRSFPVEQKLWAEPRA